MLGCCPGPGPRMCQPSLPPLAQKSPDGALRRGVLVQTKPSTGTWLSWAALSHLPMMFPSPRCPQVQTQPVKMEGPPAQAPPLPSRTLCRALPSSVPQLQALPNTLSLWKPTFPKLLSTSPSLPPLQPRPCPRGAPTIYPARCSLLQGP